MIITVTPAPALDVTISVGELTLGESLRVPTSVVRPGGKGLNASRVLAARAVPSIAVGPLGAAAGEQLSREFARAAPQAATAWTWAQAPSRTSTALLEDSGRVTVLNERAGALSAAEHVELRAAALEAARRAVAEHGRATLGVCGSWPQDTPAGTLAELVAGLRDVGARVLVDTSGGLLLEAASAGADVLKPNIHELAEATASASVDAGLERLFALGARSVLLSRGEDGMSHHTPQDRAGMGAKLSRVLVGNPTGAGDAAVAGWLASIDELGHLPESETERRGALARAVAWSAAAVLAPVAGELGTNPDALWGDVVWV